MPRKTLAVIRKARRDAEAKQKVRKAALMVELALDSTSHHQSKGQNIALQTTTSITNLPEAIEMARSTCGSGGSKRKATKKASPLTVQVTSSSSSDLAKPAASSSSASTSEWAQLEGRRTVLQRVSTSSLRQGQLAATSVREQGLPCFEAMKAQTKAGIWKSRHGNISTHLGLWLNYGQLGYPVSHELAGPVADQFLEWLGQYSKSYIESLEPLLASDLRAAFQQRTAALEEIAEIMEEKGANGRQQVAGFGTWWTTVAIIRDFTDVYHDDAEDAQPSILVNFQCPVVLELGTGQKVDVDEGDVVFFNSGELLHRVVPAEHATEEQIKGRWAVSLFTRQLQEDKALEAVWRVRPSALGGPAAREGRKGKARPLEL
ncbi:hypothetical protein BDZ90DRAFT_257740 [Jaminaea rosea]|uniref:Uncharacterized protein n=1 Tax=Jaminaea rosea TaxID=1569628 RepID=A0A316UZE1_9BASI|nr:hypothetical protein BDZ90DRAFT_257740 [Jaminaea rosea]PWN30670.1 hypothetical protein BDZ90DRAFT_257740 [Jaminaea rosea]